MHWNLAGLGHIDHRKVVVVDGRIGWVGGAGIEDHFEDGRFHDLFVRLTGPVVSQFQLVFVASLRWLGGELDGIDALFPDVSAGDIPAVVLHNAPGRTGRSPPPLPARAACRFSIPCKPDLIY